MTPQLRAQVPVDFKPKGNLFVFVDEVPPHSVGQAARRHG